MSEDTGWVVVGKIDGELVWSGQTYVYLESANAVRKELGRRTGWQHYVGYVEQGHLMALGVKPYTLFTSVDVSQYWSLVENVRTTFGWS